MANSYVKGSEVRVSASFTLSGVAADPTTVIAKVKSPKGTVTTYTPTKDSTGNYHQDIYLDTSGPWYYRFEGTGAVVAAFESSLNVDVSQFG